MVVAVEARQFSLPKPSLSSSSPRPPHITSFFFDPASLSLALMHSDSSFSLYPSLSPLSSPSLPPPQTLVPSPTSAATFLHIRQSTPNPSSCSLFLVSSPLLGGSAVLLRFYILNSDSRTFSKSRVVSNHRDLKFDEGRCGVIFKVSHGVSVKLVGSVNLFAMYSVSSSKICVFAVRLLGNQELKLMKCVVIDCSKLVFSISVSFGLLILGEESGVRIFSLKRIMKGTVKRERIVIKRNINGGEKDKGLNLQNGLFQGLNGIDAAVYSSNDGNFMCPEGDEKSDKHSAHLKLRSMKLRQDSTEGDSYFVAFKSEEFGNLKPRKKPVFPTKAISIQALTPNKFLILDSVGHLHLLLFMNSIHGSEIDCHMESFAQTMQGRKLAVFSDMSTRTQTVWISDAVHTVHMIVISDVDASVSETDRKDSDEKLFQTSVTQAIFASEKVQEIMPLSGNAVLVLGQGNMFAYAIS